MIRLAVAADEGTLRALTPRMRGATLLPLGGADFRPDTCDAIACLRHTALVRELLAAGKPLLLCGSLPGLDLPESGRLTLANPDRYLPSRRLVKEQIDSGKLGEPGLVRIRRWEPPSPDVDAHRLADLDSILWLFGRPPETVFALPRIAAPDDVTPCCHIHLGFPGGGMALLDHAATLPPGEGYSCLHVIGSAGAAYADDHQNMQLLYRGGTPLALRAGEGVKSLAALLQDFVDALNAGRDPSAGRSDWRNALLVYRAALRSMRSGNAERPEGR